MQTIKIKGKYYYKLEDVIKLIDELVALLSIK